MFERFTDRARKTMALANQEAQRLNNEYIRPEHMLLGLLEEGTGVGFHLLLNLGVDAIALRQKVTSEIKSGSEVVTMGKLPQSPPGKKVLEFAILEARALNQTYVGTEHILLGLLREGEGIAARALVQFGIRIEAAREELRSMLRLDEPPSESISRLYHIRHHNTSYWVEAPDLHAATAVWKRHFGKVPRGDERGVEDPDSIEMVFEGPVWR